ncbi:MAG TPA: cbb3-type cytochrome c oxidase subunit I, partial [Chitinophagales bacterium]|nr:cbb3-type cytochrome c oxidase subunit I [Chitinophagales bacterium]
MRYKSQKVAYWFFALSMLLLTLQIVYGFVMGFDRIGWQGLHDYIPFNTARAVHTNLLVMWLLSGFMGAAYYIIPEESEHELVNVKLAYIQLIAFAMVGVAAIVGYHFNYWEGRKFLEIPRPLDWLVVVDVLTFLGLILATIYAGKKKTTTSLV